MPTDSGFVQEQAKSLRITTFRAIDGTEKYIAMFTVRVHVDVAMRRHGYELDDNEQQQQ